MQRRHGVPGSRATRSPTRREVTEEPIAAIVPADSWPRLEEEVSQCFELGGEVEVEEGGRLTP